MWTRTLANGRFAVAYFTVTALLAYGHSLSPHSPLSEIEEKQIPHYAEVESARPAQTAQQQKLSSDTSGGETHRNPESQPSEQTSQGNTTDKQPKQIFPDTQDKDGAANAASQSEEIPIERCDKLPVVKVSVGSTEMRFLVDTGATSMLNLKSFSGGRVKEIQVTSWTGTATTSAREITIAEFSLGSHRLEKLKLPAIDLSLIGKACGAEIDGILGVDLLEKMGVTLDLKHQIASLGPAPATLGGEPGEPGHGKPADVKTMYADMEGSMQTCMDAFERGNEAVFRECLDPEVVFYTSQGEFVGREQVLRYLRERYFQYAPDLHHRMKVHEMQAFGSALWYSYEYWIDTPKEHLNGHGFAMCRRHGTRWRMLNLHNALVEPIAREIPKQ